MLATARDSGWDESAIHFEYFAGGELHSSHDRHFDVEIKSSGRVIRVEAAQAVTHALAAQGIEIPISCEQGVCTCLTRVLEGEIDHRDLYLMPEEHAKMDQFLPCCSARAIGAPGPRPVGRASGLHPVVRQADGSGIYLDRPPLQSYCEQPYRGIFHDELLARQPEHQ